MRFHGRSGNTERTDAERSYWLGRVLSGLLLVGIGAAGLVNSWGAMYAAALSHTRGTRLGSVQVMGTSISLAAATLPAVIDLLIAAASMRYLIGVRRRIPVAGWRVTAHTAIAASVLMNAAAAQRPSDWAWHVVAPLSLSVVIELFVRELLGTLGEVRREGRTDRIPLRLWITAPAESVRTWLMIARRVTGVQATARAETGQRRAAMLLVRIVLPGREHAATRRTLATLTRTGALTPSAVAVLVSGHRADPSGILPAALDQVASGIRPDVRPEPVRPAAEPVRPAAEPVRFEASALTPDVRTSGLSLSGRTPDVRPEPVRTVNGSDRAAVRTALAERPVSGRTVWADAPASGLDEAEVWAAWESAGRPNDWPTLAALLGTNPEAARKRASRR
jgi:hypothetical protein